MDSPRDMQAEKEWIFLINFFILFFYWRRNSSNEGLNGVLAYIMRGPHWQPSRQLALLRGSRWGDGFHG